MKRLRKAFILPRAGELAGLLMLFGAVLLAMALVSYQPGDASWLTRDSARSGSRNLVGPFGATLADLCFQIFGVASYFLLVPMAMGGWRRLWGRKGGGLGVTLFGHGGLLVGLLSLLAIVVGDLRVGGEEVMAGGVAGAMVAGILTGYLNTAGAFVTSVAVMALGATVATHISFGSLLQAARKAAAGGLRRARTAWVRRREQRRKERLREKIVKKHAGKEKDNGRGERPLAPAVLVDDDEEEDARDAPPPPRPAPRPSPPAMVRPKPAARQSQPPLPLDEPQRDFVLPPLTLLQSGHGAAAVDDQELYAKAKVLAEKCREFGVQGAVVEIHPGPVVTTFEFKPEAGIKYSKITGLVDDLCLALQAESVRIDRISGKSTVGIEVPNKIRETIFLRELLESEKFVKSSSKLSLAVGKRIDGEVYIADLARMPHLLIAGATGAGKSVCLNALIASMLYRATPDEVKFIFIDTKRLELGIYDEIPHLLTPVVTDPKKAANALRWACVEMERRYKMLADYGVRSIDQFNTLIRGGRGRERNPDATPEQLKPIPFIVVVVDELADLMITSGADVEEGITRLAQMARAVGIHLILSTQRPSVDVITGVIKANFPSRIAFRVSSKVDSRTILDSNGAEKLLGNGDMLFMPPGSSRLLRLHGSYMSEVESAALVDYLKKAARPVYDDSVTKDVSKEKVSYDEEEDEMFQDAVRCVLETGVASTSHLQRRLRLGYARAARLVDMMEARGIVGPPDGSKQREILVRRDYLGSLEEAQS
ncbi:MAG TPA: DNA translocase FtsK 4TM domain-containing protein [Candidatus Polarisedimenticolia bacterium]|nr:DNA translocase FtsK 4TM domain-containing protein [Candidatus Polarisedimenticolia bacterium]